MPDGRYVLTAFPGLITVADAEGQPQASFSFLKPGATIPNRFNIRQVTPAGNNAIFIAGQLSADSVFILRFSLDGSITWQHAFLGTGAYVWRMITARDGGPLVLCGVAGGLVSNSIPVAIKISPDGVPEWVRAYRNSQPQSRTLFRDISQTSNGDYVLTGRTQSSAVSVVCVLRVSDMGVPIWGRVFAPSFNGNEIGLCIRELTNGNLKVVVNSPVQGLNFGLAELSATGDVLQSMGFGGGPNTLGEAVILSDGSVLGLVGNHGIGFSVSPSGNMRFAFDYKALPNAAVLLSQVFPALDGGILWYGGYTFSFFGDFTPIIYKTTSLGTVPNGLATPFQFQAGAYVAQSSQVNFLDSAQLSLSNSAITVIPAPVLFDSLFGVPTRITPLYPADAKVRAYPNPALDKVRVEVQGAGEGEVWLLDSRGAVISHSKLESGATEFSLSAQAPGVYFVLANTPEGRRLTQVVVKL